jgi:hypothetical protein
MSCEKVIDVPLNEAEQKIVIEAVFKDAPGANYVMISKTGSVYQESNFYKVTDATVTITGSDGATAVLDHVGNGKYHHLTFQTLPQVNYTLVVEVDGQIFEASCLTRKKSEMDSLSYIPVGPPFANPEDSLSLVSFHMLDPVDEENYYWMKIFRNGNENSGYYLGNDEFINGQNFEAPFFGSEAKPGDSVMVEMMMIDKANYNYLIGLSNALNAGPFTAAPANPPTNIQGGALGFFGAYTTDSLSIIIP